MNKRHLLLQSAVATLLAASGAAMGAAGASASTAAMPADNPNMEKCFGIAKAGKNDCAGKSKTHACAGKLKASGEKESFVLVPKGTCSKIVGGKLKG